jgi:1-phosphatidylinositol-4-phosphate 5-kinase
LKRFKNPEGGKSGEFFFFSKDNRIILKTMTDFECMALKERLRPYVTHLM